MIYKRLLRSILILLGLFMLLLFIWVRFIRVRLPRDIPFNLTELGLIILIYICLIYKYIVISLILELTSNNIIRASIIKTIL
jgi:hypothetical protein